MDRRGTTLAGRYGLLSPLGKGGQAEVWLARHHALDRLVAVKILLASDSPSPERGGRFEREAKACAQLQSPHIVQVFDFGVDGEDPFLVMELLQGRDLGRIHGDKPRWTPAEIAPWIEQIARGLTVAHGAGIVHRDIKPGNLFVAEVGREHVLKILDFGIARSAEADIEQFTRPGLTLGSPSYMSPEQLMGAPIDGRTDLWSVAVVAYAFVTGRLPFTAAGASASEIADNVLRGRFAKPSEIVPSLSAATDAFFERALAFKPQARFQTAAEFAQAFTRLVTSGPAVDVEMTQVDVDPLGGEAASESTWVPPAHSLPAEDATVTNLFAPHLLNAPPTLQTRLLPVQAAELVAPPPSQPRLQVAPPPNSSVAPRLHPAPPSQPAYTPRAHQPGRTTDRMYVPAAVAITPSVRPAPRLKPVAFGAAAVGASIAIWGVISLGESSAQSAPEASPAPRELPSARQQPSAPASSPLVQAPTLVSHTVSAAPTAAPSAPLPKRAASTVTTPKFGGRQGKMNPTIYDGSGNGSR
jgi:serine/threonine-protein kinase